MWKARAIYGSNYFQEFGCDGTNVFSYLVDPNPMVPKGRPAPEMLPGVITPGVYPSSAAHYVTVPWLAFASGVHCASNMEHLRLPWAIAQAQLEAYYCKSRVIHFASSPTVQEVFFYNDPDGGENLERNPEVMATANKAKEREIAASKALQARGTLLGHYWVSQFTNLNGSIIPTQFSLEQYLPNQPGKTNILYVKYECLVTNVRNVSWTNPLPIITQPVHVFDFRFQDQSNEMNGVSFTISNNWPTSTSEPWLQDLFKNSLRQHISIVAESGIVKMVLNAVLRLALLLVLCGPPFWMFYKRWQNKKSRGPS